MNSEVEEEEDIPQAPPSPEAVTQAQILQEDDDDDDNEADVSEDGSRAPPDPLYLDLHTFSMKRVKDDLLLISRTLEHNLCLKAAMLKSHKLEASFGNIPFFNALSDYLTVWDFKEVLRFFIEKKLQALNDVKPKQVGDLKPAWLLHAQEFCVCVPCFLAGRSPQRCIFFCYNGFVCHRGVGVSEAISTVETLCVKPAEFSGFRTQVGQNGKNAIYPGVNKKKGIEKGDFVKFEMPFLRTTASTFRPVSVSIDDVKKVWVFADRVSEDDLIDDDARGEIHFLEWINNLVLTREK